MEIQLHNPSLADNAEAIAVALFSAAVNRYDTMVAVMSAVTRNAPPFEVPIEVRQEWAREGFDNVTKRLGQESPYRDVLEKVRDEFLRELASPSPDGPVRPRLSLVP